MAPLDLHPIQPTDEAPPGYIVFACWKESENRQRWNIRNFWLVMVVKEDTMPDQLRRARPPKPMGRFSSKSDEHCAVWVIGKGQFLWVPRKAMYYPAADQLHKFRDTEMSDDFGALYRIARQRNNLDKYRDEILADKARIDMLANRRDPKSTDENSLFLTVDDSSSDDGANSHLKDSSSSEQPAPKRARTTTDARTARSSTIPARPLPGEADAPITPPASTESASATLEPEIKAEVGDDGFPIDLMDVHVGGRKFRISEVDLQQSSVLTSYILRRPGRDPWIMDPDLAEVSAADFEAVRQFLQTAEFEPVYIHRAAEERAVEGSGSLEGVADVVGDSEQVRRLGRLYCLARRFELATMQGLVFKKLKAGFPGGWDPRVMMRMIEQVFRDVPGTVDDAASVEMTGEKDGLKEWLVGWLAFNMQWITETGSAAAKMYWGVLNRTPGLRLAVSRVDARNVEKYKGVLVDVEGYEDAKRRGQSGRRPA